MWITFGTGYGRFLISVEKIWCLRVWIISGISLSFDDRIGELGEFGFFWWCVDLPAMKNWLISKGFEVFATPQGRGSFA